MCGTRWENLYMRKSNQELSIGDINGGLDLNKINEIYAKFYDIKKKNCINCPVSRLCDVCFVHFIKNNNLSFNKEFCDKRKKSYIRALELIYTKIFENDEILDIDSVN